jgi:membrane protease YdiL (CAAX protease family)
VRQIQMRRVLAPERYRGPAVIVLLAMVLLISTVLVAPFSSDANALLGGGGELSVLGALVILVSTSIGLLLVSWLFVAMPNALAALPSFPGREPQRALLSGLGWGVVAWIGSTALLVIAAWVLEQIGMPPEPGAAELAIQRVDPWLIVLAIVIGAPIAEEIFFRGVVFNAWLREGGRAYAYIGSAALFAVIHLSLVSLVPIFFLGLALAWVYERSGSLLAPIAMHATVNGISVALTLLARFDIVRLPV